MNDNRHLVRQLQPHLVTVALRTLKTLSKNKVGASLVLVGKPDADGRHGSFKIEATKRGNLLDKDHELSREVRATLRYIANEMNGVQGSDIRVRMNVAYIPTHRNGMR